MNKQELTDFLKDTLSVKFLKERVSDKEIQLIIELKLNIEGEELLISTDSVVIKN